MDWKYVYTYYKGSSGRSGFSGYSGFLNVPKKHQCLLAGSVNHNLTKKKERSLGLPFLAKIGNRFCLKKFFPLTQNKEKLTFNDFYQFIQIPLWNLAIIIGYNAAAAAC